MTFSTAAQKEIDKLYKGRHHVELSIGILWNGETEVLHLGPDGKEVGGPLRFAEKNLDGSLPYLAVCHEVHGPCEKNANSGLAWRLEKDAPISWHTGSAGAFSAWLGLNREIKCAVAVAVNYGLVNAEQIGFAIPKNDL